MCSQPTGSERQGAYPRQSSNKPFRKCGGNLLSLLSHWGSTVHVLCAYSLSKGMLLTREVGKLQGKIAFKKIKRPLLFTAPWLALLNLIPFTLDLHRAWCTAGQSFEGSNLLLVPRLLGILGRGSCANSKQLWFEFRSSKCLGSALPSSEHQLP